MRSDLEARLRSKLQPCLLDGTEAIERIVLMLHSPSRPPDLRRAIASVLRSIYRDTVHVDTLLQLMADEIEQHPASKEEW
jgi:hypothetical protein